MYPTVSNLTNAISAMGLSIPTFITSGAVEASIIQFEQLTGRIPFVALSGTVSLPMTPEGATSNWRDGYGGSKYLILSTNMITVSAVLLDGVTVSASTYNLYPDDYSIKGIPIEGIIFDTPIYSGRQELTIIGRPGYSTSCPADVYQAILLNAINHCQTQYSYLQMGGLGSIKEADLALTAGAENAGNMNSMFTPLFQAVVNRYKRII